MIMATGTIGQRGDHAQIPRQRAEHRPLAGSQVDQDLRPFGGGEEQPTGWLGRRQDAAVRSDECESPIVGEGQVINPGC